MHNHKVQINVKENRIGNQEWTIQIHWRHWAHKTQDKQNTKDNTENTTEKQHDTIVIKCYRRESISCIL